MAHPWEWLPVSWNNNGEGQKINISQGQQPGNKVLLEVPEARPDVEKVKQVTQLERAELSERLPSSFFWFAKMMIFKMITPSPANAEPASERDIDTPYELDWDWDSAVLTSEVAPEEIETPAEISKNKMRETLSQLHQQYVAIPFTLTSWNIPNVVNELLSAREQLIRHNRNFPDSKLPFNVINRVQEKINIYTTNFLNNSSSTPEQTESLAETSKSKVREVLWELHTSYLAQPFEITEDNILLVEWDVLYAETILDEHNTVFPNETLPNRNIIKVQEKIDAYNNSLIQAEETIWMKLTKQVKAQYEEISEQMQRILAQVTRLDNLNVLDTVLLESTSQDSFVQSYVRPLAESIENKIKDSTVEQLEKDLAEIENNPKEYLQNELNRYSKTQLQVLLDSNNLVGEERNTAERDILKAYEEMLRTNLEASIPAMRRIIELKRWDTLYYDQYNNTDSVTPRTTEVWETTHYTENSTTMAPVYDTENGEVPGDFLTNWEAILERIGSTDTSIDVGTVEKVIKWVDIDALKSGDYFAIEDFFVQALWREEAVWAWFEDFDNPKIKDNIKYYKASKLDSNWNKGVFYISLDGAVLT